MLNRKETTQFLIDLLISDRLSDRKYFAKEVTLDYGTDHTKRIDIIQFLPQGVIHTSDIEKGIFICYEIKSCKQDIYSGNGLNFFGEKNYIVTTMECYKAIQEDLRNGVLSRYIKENYPESSNYYGFIVPVPNNIDLRNTDAIFAEYDNPTPLDKDIHNWKMHTIYPCREGFRTRSSTELLFCMLRSKHSYTNKNKDIIGKK